MTIFWLILAGLFLMVAVTWLVVPALYGLPWVPTREKRIRRALELAELKPGETLFDLGAGDGRVLVMAAKDFGADAVGIEIGPVQCLVGWLRILLNGSRPKVRLRCGNFYRTDISSADVVFIYATSSQTFSLLPLLEQSLRPGARVVSIAADFSNWVPKTVDRENLIFLYEVPPERQTGYNQ